jgi:hypothetical protein
MAERSRALNYGGIGAIHLMGQRLGLAEEIDARLQLLRRHLLSTTFNNSTIYIN